LAVYVPGTTQLNGVAIPDDLGTSQLWSQHGLALTEVNPDVDLRVRWEMLIISPIAAGTPIDTRVVAEWDGNHSIALAAPTLHVLSSPSLEAGAAGTPISVAQLMPALEAPPAEAIAPPAAAQPTSKAAAIEPAMLEPAGEEPETPVEVWAPAEAAAEEVVPSPVLYVDFTHEQLAQTIRALEKSEAGGLIQHLVALAALYPNALAGADARTAQTVENSVRAIRAPLERLFVRLSMPRLTISARDLEDRDSRFALRALAEAVIDGPRQELSERPFGTVRFSGAVDVDAVRARLPELQTAPLGAVTPWSLNVQFLGSRFEYNHGGSSDALGSYRNELLKVFGVLETLPMPEFHRVLSSSVNRTLDDALANVLDALRTAAHIAVD
jgi:hypothetical protein